MLKPALAAALIVGVASSSALAKKSAVQYEFGTAGGGVYCDGLLLSNKGKIYTGTHNSPTGSCTEGDQAGGFETSGFASNAMGSFDTVTKKTSLISVTSEDPNGGTNFELVFNLDVKNSKWAVFVIADGASPVNGGPLVIGTDAQVRPQIGHPAFQK
jgi:hypothetical protein